MPNYCDNELTVRGSQEDVERFIQDCVAISIGYPNKDNTSNLDLSFDFEKILPTPTKENGELIDEWYSWRLNNWGTKWNVCDTGNLVVRNIHNEKDPNNYEFGTAFTTAWCPPYELYKYLMEKYKDTSLKISVNYYEGGCAFAGKHTYYQGEVIDDYYVEYKSNQRENNIEYYEYVLKEGYEDTCYIEECIADKMERNEYSEEEINKTIKLIAEYYEEKNFAAIAELFIDKVLM